MAYKEWEPDEFLDEFLDFNYSKPVPEKAHEKSSKGLPAEKQQKTEKKNNGYGLGNDFRVYDDLRHENNRSAGTQTSAEADTKDLRASDALRNDIPEPLSAKRAAHSRQPEAHKAAPASGAASHSGAAQPVKAASHSGSAQAGKNAKSVQAAANSSRAPFRKEPKIEDIDDSVIDEYMSANTDSRPRKRHLRASELAAGALSAAKKFVASDENTEPETIPPVSQDNGLAGGHSRKAGQVDVVPIAPLSKKDKAADRVPVFAEKAEKDELAELFAELGEGSGSAALSSEENEALAQAQSEAYDRYRGNYIKGLKKRLGASKVGWFPRWLSRFYVILAAVFAVVMTVMNVLPFSMLVALYVVLGLLSLIIVVQLRKQSTGRGIRALASLTAVLLMALYGVGTAYSLGTLSFLDFTSVKNENRVGAVTRDPFNVCFTGIDVYGSIDKQGRSDVNMILTVNPKTEQILLTSIPRDYEIYMPDKDMAMDKLTHTGFYSVDTTMKAEENLLDTKINYYVKVNFTTVKAFIYSIGGIDVYSEYEFTPVKREGWTVKKGWNHMDGKQALAFARERKAFIDGDNQRIKNQQAVFEAILKKATSSKTMVLSYNKILNGLRDYFQMSFSSSELRSLIKLQLAKNPEWKIYKNTIIGGNGSMPTYSTGGAYAYVMTQDPESIDHAKTLINAVLEGKMLEKDSDNNVTVVGGETEEGGTEDSGDTEG